MTYSETKAEHRHVYETRLGILGFITEPPAWAHNLAVMEADAHMAALRKQEKADNIERLQEMRKAL